MAHTISDQCSGCGACPSECPAEAISEGSPFVIDASLCTDCGICVDLCPMEAIKQA